ncbi:MAG: pantetheine-phosphate adenylyltransferase [Bifidobacteriaceae bacterium]|jgi:pantetheine-phosphate adenylyltransferase|nr:pantetheine-phosphate adenylyltransferase [Bifidobacteriaceae bacterium]
MKNIAVYPGSFDPVTRGHIDIIDRSYKLFDEIHIVTFINSSKSYTFSEDERVELIKKSLIEKNIPMENIIVTHSRDLVANYCKNVNASAVIKGIRNTTDFDNEFSQALLNRELVGIETLLMPTSTIFSFVSSTFVKNVAEYDGNISDFVTDAVENALKIKNADKPLVC